MRRTQEVSVFVAVNEKGQAGEALRVPHDRQVYREFLARLPALLNRISAAFCLNAPPATLLASSLW